MLGENERDKSLQRNQMLAVVLMTVLILVWSFFFMPTTPPVTPPPADQAVPAQTTSESQPAQAERTAPATTEPADQTAAEPGAPRPDLRSDEQLGPDVVLRDDYLELAFTKVGARLKQATVVLGDNGHNSVQLVRTREEQGVEVDGEAAYPLGLLVAGDLGEKANDRAWTVVPTDDPEEARFELEWPGVARITKSYRLGSNPHVVEVSVVYTHLGDRTRLGLDMESPAFSLLWEPGVESGDLHKRLAQPSVIWRKDGEIEHHYTKDFDPADGRTKVRGLDYLGMKSAYFLVAMKPEPAEGDAPWWGWYEGEKKNYTVGVGVPSVTVEPGDTVTGNFRLYLGPTHASHMQAAWHGLDESLQFIISVRAMDWFAKFLLGILNWFHDHVIANYGLAIIFLTVLVRVAVFPLTLKSMRSMKAMQKLAPEMEKLKKEIGDDQQELQKRMMEMYKERGVNPLGGCLPMVLQLPVFIALYRMLATAFELRRAPFFGWITDLSEPDKLMEFGFQIPVPFMEIDSLNVLPILMGVAMVISMKVTPTAAVQNAQQKMLMTIMPIFFALICYNMAAGLNLYILTSTILGIAQNWVVHITDINVDVTPKKKAGAKKYSNFYAAAQARKREMAKDARREKRGRAQGGEPKKGRKKP